MAKTGKRVLVTGGAGFVGSSLALALKRQHPDWQVHALDNLRRRGSELSIDRLRAGGVTFTHGDVRSADDLGELGPVELLLECSAEPSVLAGLQGSPAYVLQTNLVGTINCLEHARRCRADLIFFSTSRVYPIATLSALPCRSAETRFELDFGAATPPTGASEHGIAEDFSLQGARSIYGATKLCSELLIEEYAAAYGLRAVINRCGVLTGPWQMGKVDQGVVTYWVLAHLLGRPLRYLGYGGEGKQVRDILHVHDLAELVELQLADFARAAGGVYNVGGGRTCSVSLCELTELCRVATSRVVEIEGVAETRAADVPIFITDARRAQTRFGWKPRHTPVSIVEEIATWAGEHRDALVRALDPS